MLALAPFFLTATLLLLAPFFSTAGSPQAEVSSEPNLTRTLGNATGNQNRTLATNDDEGDAGDSGDDEGDAGDNGNESDPTEACNTFKEDLRTGPLFPIIPDSGRGGESGFEGCTTPFWDRIIIGIFIYKFLGIANYFAGALAVLATIYAGILYLTGFAGEQTVKQAKAILIGTYIGFFIVLSARLIVAGSFYLFGDPTSNDEVLEIGE